MEINKIFNLNCKKLFKNMKANNIMVDSIITDPPYNISRKNNFTSLNRQGIDFGDWDKGFDQTKWIEECSDLLSPGGSFIIFNDWKNMGLISYKLEQMGLIVKDLIRWEKPNPMPRNINRRYVTDFEFAIWAVKPGSKWVFNKPDNVPYLKPFYKHSTESGLNRFHPTQKSLTLMREMIKVHTKKDDLILDPFMGSGTTAAAAILEKRRFIGSEINKLYFEGAEKRIEELVKEKKIL